MLVQKAFDIFICLLLTMERSTQTTYDVRLCWPIFYRQLNPLSFQYCRHVCSHAGIVCLELADLEHRLGKTLDAKTHLCLAENVIRISQGRNISTYTDRIIPLMMKYFDM
mgnify:CR=1 FL=1